MNDAQLIISNLFLPVRRFDTDNDAINSHYNFYIEIISPQAYSLNFFKEQKALLTWPQNFRHGIITTVYDRGKQKDGYCYELILSSILHPLLLNIQSRVFVRKYLTDILKTIFSDLNFNLSQDIFVPYLIQHRESDFGFFVKTLQVYQWSWIYMHSENQTRVIITDDLNRLTYNLGKIKNLTQTPIITENSFIQLETNNTSLIPGYLVNFNNYTYRILNIDHDKHHLLHYRAKLKLISADIKNFNYILKNRTPYLTAHTYGDLTQAGQYTSRLYFSPDNTSEPQYLIEPHHGMHFPLPKNTRVIVSHIDGNINQPILLGVITENNPVIDQNNSQHIYHHQILIDDRIDQYQIKLNTPDNSNYFLQAINDNSIYTELNSNIGSIFLRYQKDLYLNTDQSYNQQANSYYLNIQNNQTVQAQSVNIQSEKNIILLSKNNLAIESENIWMKSAQQIFLNIKNTFNVKSRALSLKTMQNSFLIHGQKNIILKSHQINLQRVILNNSGIVFNTAQLKVNAQSIRCPPPTQQ